MNKFRREIQNYNKKTVFKINVKGKEGEVKKRKLVIFKVAYI